MGVRHLTPEESLSNADAVLRITASHRTFDWLQPYNKHGSTESTGTGFILQELLDASDRDSFLLLTAYHVVRLAKQVHVRIDAGGSRLVEASLVVCNPRLDVAVLRVPTALPKEVRPLRAGDSDAVAPLQSVQVLGYALGKTHLQYTQGVVSGRTSDRLQLDAAVNGGNSGGPLLSQAGGGGVLGIVTSGYMASAAQNMNFACPLHEAMLSMRALLRDRADARAVGFVPPTLWESPPSFNAHFAITPSAFLESRGLSNGIVCTFLSPDSALHAAGMRRGDVLTEIDGHRVQFDRTIRPSFWGGRPLAYDSLLFRARVRDPMHITFARGQEEKSATIELQDCSDTYREMHSEFEKVRYCAHGGIVVQQLVPNLLNQKANRVFSFKFNSLLDPPEARHRSTLVVTHVLPTSPFRSEQTVAVGDVIVSVNGIPIHGSGNDGAFEKYLEIWKKALQPAPSSGFVDVVTIATREGGIACARVKDIIEAEKTMQSDLGVSVIDS